MSLTYCAREFDHWRLVKKRPLNHFLIYLLIWNAIPLQITIHIPFSNFAPALPSPSLFLCTCVLFHAPASLWDLCQVEFETKHRTYFSLIYMEDASCTFVNTAVYAEIQCSINDWRKYQGLTLLLVGWWGCRYVIPNSLLHHPVFFTCCHINF